MEDYKIHIAGFLLRCFAGILFFFQGYDKVFRLKIPTVIQTFMEDAGRYSIPRWLVASVTYYTSYAELVSGGLLILGLFTTTNLYFLSADLILVCFAFSFIEPMWDMKHVFPRLILTALLLILPLEQNHFSLDYIIKIFIKS